MIYKIISIMCQKNINAESIPYKSKKRRASRLAFFDFLLSDER